MIYFVQDVTTGFIKVGFTAGNPLVRLRHLQTGCPGLLHLLAVNDGGRGAEAWWHRMLKGDRERGEWFRPDRLAVVLSDNEYANVVLVDARRGTRQVEVCKQTSQLTLAEFRQVCLVYQVRSLAYGRHSGTLNYAAYYERLAETLRGRCVTRHGDDPRRPLSFVADVLGLLQSGGPRCDDGRGDPRRES